MNMNELDCAHIVWYDDGFIKSVLECKYSVEVKTANEKYAGTDNIIKIEIFAKKGQSSTAYQWITLDNKGKDDNERNQ